MCGVKEFVCLFVTNFDPKYLGTGRTEWAEIFLQLLWQNECSQKILFVRKVVGRTRAEGQNSNILIHYLSCLAWDRAEILKIVINL